MDPYREMANQMLLAISGPMHSHGGPEDWEHALAIATAALRQAALDAEKAMREAATQCVWDFGNDGDGSGINADDFDRKYHCTWKTPLSEVVRNLPSLVPPKEQ